MPAKKNTKTPQRVPAARHRFETHSTLAYTARKVLPEIIDAARLRSRAPLNRYIESKESEWARIIERKLAALELTEASVERWRRVPQLRVAEPNEADHTRAYPGVELLSYGNEQGTLCDLVLKTTVASFEKIAPSIFTYLHDVGQLRSFDSMDARRLGHPAGTDAMETAAESREFSRQYEIEEGEGLEWTERLDELLLVANVYPEPCPLHSVLDDLVKLARCDIPELAWASTKGSQGLDASNIVVVVQSEELYETLMPAYNVVLLPAILDKDLPAGQVRHDLSHLTARDRIREVARHAYALR